jgi:hypothetical protein
MSCPVNSETIKNGIFQYAENQLEQSTFFEREGDLFLIKDEDSDYQSVIDGINISFGETLVMKLMYQPYVAILEPSAALIIKYLKAANQSTPDVNNSINDEFDKLYQSATPVDTISPTLSSKAGLITKNKVLHWLDTIGFKNIKNVANLTYNGQVLPGRAYIDFAASIMQIVEGQEDFTLPEEAMTIFLQLIKQSRPELYSAMMRDITSYKIYGEVLTDPAYKNNPFYQYTEAQGGGINYDKIKEEAITKLLAEYVINKFEGTEESAKKLETAKSWFKALIDWIRFKFGQYKNPFEQTLKEINQDPKKFGEYTDINSDELFLSAKPLDQVDNENPDNKSVWEKIKNQAASLGIHKIGPDYYDKNGNKVSETQRVSDLKTQYYKKRFGKQSLDPTQREFYDKIAEDGTLIHAMIEDIINAYVDPSTGLIKKNPAEFETDLNNPVHKKIFNKLHKFMKDMLTDYEKQHGQGTRILTEQIVFDENAINEDKSRGRYGTIDFLAVLPDGSIDILDWKSTLFKELEDVKDYKKEGYFVQLNEYKRMLQTSYDVKSFGKIRAIPINQHHKKIEGTDKTELRDIGIGEADASKISKDDKRLRPIISPEERTGSETRDALVEKLEQYYKRYINRGYFKDNRDILEDVQEAIYEIRTANTVDNLSEYLLDLTIKFKKLLDDNQEIEKLSKDDISDILASIQVFRETATDLFETSIALAEDETISQESRIRLVNVAERMNYFKLKGNKLEEKLLNKQAKDENVFNLLKPEKVVHFFQRTFRAMGSLPVASVRLMYELVKKSYNKINISLDTDIRKLKDLKFNYEEWRKANNLSDLEALKKLVNFEKGGLHGKIDKAFYEERKRVFDSKDGKLIKKFVEENYDLEAYEADYKKKLKENIELWGNRDFENEDEKKAYVKYRTLEFKKKWDLKSSPVTAFGDHNKLIWSRGIKEENWLSKEYQEIEKSPALKEIYGFFIEKNKQLAETGAIEEWEIYTFFPNVRKSFADIVTLEDKNIIKKSGEVLYNIYDDFRQSMTVSDYELNFQGAVSETGEKLDKRFVPYISKLKTEEKSFDIFKVYGLMSKEIHKERYLQENDTILRSLSYFEQHKKTLEQNKYGVLNKQGEKYKESQEGGANFKAYEMHYKAIVLGEALQIENDFVFSPRVREKWNNSPLGKLYKFDTEKEYDPTNISATKFIFWLNNLNTKRILGFNAGSVISNLFGGAYSANRLFEKYTSKDDINKAWLKLSSGAFWATEEMKKNAALADYFLPLLDNKERDRITQLSVSEASARLSGEWLMAPMRKTSEIVQLNIFFAILENTGIVEGKIVNLREKAAEDSGYYERFSKSPEERKTIEKDFKDKIVKYKKDFGLAKQAQFKTIKEAGKDKVIIEIPGIDRNSKDVENLREIVRTMSKDALGEADEFDMMGYKYSLTGRLLMTFKNWIPKTIDVRWGEFRYDQAHHAYEYGRFRMFARSLSANYMNALLRVLPFSSKIMGKESLVSKARQIYTEKMREAQELGLYDEKTFIKEGEFVERFIKGVETTYTEFRMAAGLLFFLMWGIAAPDADDDKETKAYKALLRRQIEKLMDEITFFYSPKSGVDILGTSAPITSIVKDSYKLASDATQQFFGFTLSTLGAEDMGDEMQDKAKPVKRFFKVVPVLKEVLTYLPALDPDLAEEWGVKPVQRINF